jgi:hypothetical protein
VIPIEIEKHLRERLEPDVEVPPEVKEIASAILLGALRDLKKKQSKKTPASVKKMTYNWFNLTDDGIFSFLWCCKVLNLNSLRVKQRAEEIFRKSYSERDSKKVLRSGRKQERAS